ncbi:MAG: hypothetical protein QM757_13605 [Paludibaculum sp.]
MDVELIGARGQKVFDPAWNAKGISAFNISAPKAHGIAHDNSATPSNGALNLCQPRFFISLPPANGLASSAVTNKDGAQPLTGNSLPSR